MHLATNVDLWNPIVIYSARRRTTYTETRIDLETERYVLREANVPLIRNVIVSVNIDILMCLYCLQNVSHKTLVLNVNVCK